MSEPISLVDAAVAIRAGRLEPVELLDRCLEQIRRHEDRIHAWVVVDEAGARRTAAERGRQAARGEFLGPLHGIPVGIKDIIDVEGLPTRAGSPLRRDHRARADAPLVAALRRAGAVILGKTVTVEFACFDPSPTRNPWNTAHTPGGSSSGSAAAVALNMCLGALGTQTGGSLVRPSTYCGIATCKPTFGRLPMEGIVPVSYHLDHPGPMAHTVADLALLLGCLLNPSGVPLHGVPLALPVRDVPVHGVPLATPVHDLPSADRPLRVDLSLPQPPRLGLLQGSILEDAEPRICAVTEMAVARLRGGGAGIDAIDLPDEFHDVPMYHRRIMAVEAAAYHRETFAGHRDQYGPMIAGLLDEGLGILGVDYAAALAWQREFRGRAAALLVGVDALVMPSTHTTAPATLDTTGTPRFQAPWSCAGLPVVSIPCGVADDGMPAAIQVIGRHDGEAELLRVAAWCERQIGFRSRPPLPPGEGRGGGG